MNFCIYWRCFCLTSPFTAMSIFNMKRQCACWPASQAWTGHCAIVPYNNSQSLFCGSVVEWPLEACCQHFCLPSCRLSFLPTRLLVFLFYILSVFWSARLTWFRGISWKQLFLHFTGKYGQVERCFYKMYDSL